jgi:hypothetical protein
MEENWKEMVLEMLWRGSWEVQVTYRKSGLGNWEDECPL